MPATFDFINNRFFDQKIKTQKVIFQDCSVQEFGDLNVLGSTIGAGSGITLSPTGDFLLNGAAVTLGLVPAPGLPPTLQSTTVVPDKKIVNFILVPVQLVATNIATGVITTFLFTIPVQGLLEVPGVSIGDTIQKHDVQIERLVLSFFPPNPLAPTVITLTLKAILEMCVIVTSERVLKVNAADEFC